MNGRGSGRQAYPIHVVTSSRCHGGSVEGHDGKENNKQLEDDEFETLYKEGAAATESTVEKAPTKEVDAAATESVGITRVEFTELIAAAIALVGKDTDEARRRVKDICERLDKDEGI